MDDLLEKVDYVSCLPEGWRIKRTKYEFTIINGYTVQAAPLYHLY